MLPVSEVENLFLLPSVANAILDYDSHDVEEKAVRLSKLKADLFAEAARPDIQSAIVVEHCRRRIDRALKIVSFEDVEDEGELGVQLTSRIASINVAALAKEIRDAINKAISDDDIPALLRVYDRKSHVVATAAHLRGVRKDVFAAWAVRAIKDPKKPGLRDAIKEVVPAINAASVATS
ncbi:hypothetical protein FJ420_32330 [Mesorhizobium sp. B3-1-3]|uniref:hypothetical protein n=1 Tax=unclassified Mesorhizobium TaxID=325217 RepID=UPI00112711B8|nr:MULTISPECIES: hypothetical protein [unclassified Mesorhizobium]TPI52675.1 hypothetical protein FJ424_32780 [Mesorhizobium sp. B3-1-8]TPI59660.1 hypothetical protein FJ420_32330 [Mesorhizobium sp. B3-1-3]